jgi:hypothetical protein
VKIQANDQDSKKAMTLEAQIKIYVIAQKFQGVSMSKKANIEVNLEEQPKIVESYVNRGGLSTIVFS